MKTTKKLLAAAAVLAVTMGSQNAMAGTATGSVDVSATLTAACFIGDGTLAFGSFASIAESGTTAGNKADIADVDNDTGAINYVCSNGASATLGIAGANDSSQQLRMKHGTADYLAYNIYTDSGRTAQVTPAGSGATAIPLTEDGTDQTITLYGRVPGATANRPLGAYADTLTLTVTY